MLAERREKDLDGRLVQAEQSGIAELKKFAQGIRLDYAAVKAAFSSEWSNGQVEAQANCLNAHEADRVWPCSLRFAPAQGSLSCVISLKKLSSEKLLCLQEVLLQILEVSYLLTLFYVCYCLLCPILLKRL